MSIRIACFADIHGVLPDPVGIECDLAIVAGDVCPEMDPTHQAVWLESYFVPWLQNFPRAVWVAGNHDYACNHRALIPHKSWNHCYLEDTGICRLFDSFNTINQQWNNTPISGLRIWGTPWSLPYGRYSFMATEEEISRHLGWVASYKPHILVSHGPPYGHGDVGHRHENAGSQALLTTIREHQPWLVIYGHIHESRGVYHEGDSLLVNAAMAGESVGLGLDHPPIFVELDDTGAVVSVEI